MSTLQVAALVGLAALNIVLAYVACRWLEAKLPVGDADADEERWLGL